MNLWENFDKNEIWILVMLAVAYIIVFILARKFYRHITALFFLWGFTIGVLFDFTIGGGLMDYYVLNDTDKYEVFDFLYYLLFGPFSYIFIYLYDSFKINKKTFIWYIAVWALIGTGMQWVFTNMGIIQFKEGYELFYSFPVFLMTQTITGLYYELVKSKTKVLLPKTK
ncbi:hypothetical protein [Halobacillus sp. Marseille-P3879]|uniref:hypothetical protein n=1 Tax=Halobacillus sp. Marseille-P3879 TaxID=2045014 RepID=UPI000C7AE70D|nr:hypothetical protein [Halobacillus sp. Marseille-P3879]